MYGWGSMVTYQLDHLPLHLLCVGLHSSKLGQDLVQLHGQALCLALEDIYILLQRGATGSRHICHLHPSLNPSPYLPLGTHARISCTNVRKICRYTTWHGKGNSIMHPEAE